MLPDRVDFYRSDVEPLETALLMHPLGGLFNGELFTAGEQKFEGLELTNFGRDPIVVLDAVSTARLFMAPDESLIRVNRLPEQPDGAPAGIYVESDNPFIQENEPVTVIAYQNQDGGALRIDHLYIKRILLDPGAPERFCTVAFGLMAVTAYKLGFTRITLYAAGRAPVKIDDPDEMVGFIVWPKFGFDAPVDQAEVAASATVKKCKSVQEVLAADPEWWENEGGFGREMTFNLAPGSDSWHVLLNYTYGVIAQ